MNQRGCIPSDLRVRLETARLELLALFRALDQLTLTAPEIPQSELHELFELDADFAEALMVLDQPPPAFDVQAMVRDTLASLEALPEARQTFLGLLPEASTKQLASLQNKVRRALKKKDAYDGIHGCDPQS